jgi:uncharacterized membrane protein YfcA
MATPGEPLPTVPDRDRFHVQVALFVALAVFLVSGGVLYGLLSDEAAGTVLLILTGGFAAIVAGYLAFQDRLARTAAGTGRAEHEAEADGAEGEEEPFLPHTSIWPFEMGAGLATALAGVVLGWALLIPGVLLLGHSVMGWIGQSRRRV